MTRKGRGNQGLHASEKPLMSSEHDPCVPEDKRGRVVEFEDAPNRDEMMVERESEGRRPSERRAEDNENRGAPISNYGATPNWSTYPSNAFPNSNPFYTQHTNPLPNAPVYPSYGPTGLFAYFTGCVTPFVSWIEDYPLPDGLKMPSHVGSYDGKGDPDNYLHLFEGAIHMQKWAMPVACHMFTYTLKDSSRIW
ncbi:hypothetical protein Tco_0738279 [Tanacetum coccineum]